MARAFFRIIREGEVDVRSLGPEMVEDEEYEELTVLCGVETPWAGAAREE